MVGEGFFSGASQTTARTKGPNPGSFLQARRRSGLGGWFFGGRSLSKDVSFFKKSPKSQKPVFGLNIYMKLHDELEYNRSLHKHIGRNVVFEPAGNERGAYIYIYIFFFFGLLCPFQFTFFLGSCMALLLYLVASNPCAI